MKIKIYVGCALTNVPDKVRNKHELSIRRLKSGLMTSGYEVLEFIGLVAGTAGDVYRHDSECVSRCDLFLAVCDYPAIGLGMEIGYAIAISKPTLLTSRGKITRMAPGAAEMEPLVSYERYSDTNSLLALVDAELDKRNLRTP